MAEISAELTLKVAGLQAGLEKARAEMASFKKYAATQGRGIGSEFGASMKSGLGNLAGIIGVPLGIGAMVEGMRRMAEHADRIEDTAAALNATVEGVQRLEYMAAGTTTPMDQMTAGLIRVKRALFEVDDEAKSKALQSIGIQASQFMSLDADQAFIQLARSFQQAQADGRGFSEVFDLVKKAAPDLIPALRMSADELERMGKHAVMSADAIRAQTEALGNLKTAGLESMTFVGQSIGGYQKLWEAIKGGVTKSRAGGGFWEGWNEAMTERITRMQKEMGMRDELAHKEAQHAEAERAQMEKTKQLREQEEEAKKAAAARKASEQKNNSELDVAVLELRARGRFRDAQKLENRGKEIKDYQRLRDQHPEMGEEWARDMAHRKAEAEDRLAHPGRVRGYAPPPSAYGSKLDAMHGRGSLRSEMKFPGLDAMSGKLDRQISTLEHILASLREG